MDNKLEHIIVEYLNKCYGDLTEYRINKYPGSVFFVKNKKVYMEQKVENGRLWIDENTIWSDLENLFSLEYNEIQSIIKKWVEEDYNLRGITPLIILMTRMI